MKEIRLLRADEIEVRVQAVRENGCSLLLYKDARCDMKILDETFGIYGWRRKHRQIGESLFCEVEIYDRDKEQWIAKEDVGKESYADKEKGAASDSFKRACVNVGIGRELYTAPFIWVASQYTEIKNYKGKLVVSDYFTVKDIEYDEKRNISYLTITNRKGDIIYQYGKRQIRRVA